MRNREKSESIQQYLLEHAAALKSDLVATAAQHFGISRQAIHGHVKKLVLEGKLKQTGNTRGASYNIFQKNVLKLTLTPRQAEDEHAVWGDQVLPSMLDVSLKSLDIWSYAFTEMLNNATNHSEGSQIRIAVWQSIIDSWICINDNGIGIFNKIQRGLGLQNKRDVIVELMKGGTTTDRQNHTGLGIFYSSQMMDAFAILSEGLTFTRVIEDEVSLVSEDALSGLEENSGTWVLMRLRNQTDTPLKQFFDQVAPDVNSAQPTIGELQLHVVERNGQRLVSRSQAKMLMARMDVYKIVKLDFKGVDLIGQAFADQIFRIFKREHPEVEIVAKNANKDVQKMINMAESLAAREKQDLSVIG